MKIMKDVSFRLFGNKPIVTQRDSGFKMNDRKLSSIAFLAFIALLS